MPAHHRLGLVKFVRDLGRNGIRHWQAVSGERLEARNLLSGTPALIAAAVAASQQLQSIPAASGSSADQLHAQEPDLTVTGGTVVYNGCPQEVIGTATGGEDSYPINGTFAYTYNGSTTAPTNPGTYAVVAAFTSSDPNFANGTAKSTLIITPAFPTIEVTGGTFLFDFNPHPATATAIGIDGVTPVAGSFSFTYNSSSDPPVNGGSYAVVATFTSSDPDYANGSATGTITIPDPTIPTGVTVSGESTTSVNVAWNSVVEPSGGSPTYNVYERIFHPGHGGGKGGIVPSYYSYNLVASGLTTTSAEISGLNAAAAGGTASGHSYVVTSILGGVESTRSTAATGAPLYAPSIGFYLNGGALWSGSFPVSVTVGQTLNSISVQGYGNESPTYSVASGPSCVSIDPSSGVISISPTAADVGTFAATFTATNSLGSATTAPLMIHVLALPTVVVTGGTFSFDGTTHSASAVAYASDGVTPLAGTFSFQYAPSFYPTALSTAPYAESGTYIVQATFTSTDPNYGSAVGTGTITIAPTMPTLIVDDGSFVDDGASHGASAIAVGIDGVTPVSGTFDFTYAGLSSEPIVPGSYPVVATFTSNESDYSNAIGAGTIVIGASQTTLTSTITLGTTAAFDLSGAPIVSGPAHIVNNGAGTLELTGFASDATAQVSISNNSTAEAGILVSGTNQVVGGIDGTGNLVVDAGGNLTAGSIVQNTLSIGAGATVTIAPSGGSMGGSSADAANTTDVAATSSLSPAAAARLAAARAQRLAALLLAEGVVLTDSATDSIEAAPTAIAVTSDAMTSAPSVGSTASILASTTPVATSVQATSVPAASIQAMSVPATIIPPTIAPTNNSPATAVVVDSVPSEPAASAPPLPDRQASRSDVGKTASPSDPIAFDQWFSQVPSDLGSSSSIESSNWHDISDPPKSSIASSSTTFVGNDLDSSNGPRTSHGSGVLDQNALHDAIDTVFAGDDDFAFQDDSLTALLATDAWNSN